MIEILKRLKKYKWATLLIMLLIFLQALVNLYLPTLMGDIVDNGVVTGDISYIWKLGGLMLLVSILGILFSVLASYYSAKVAMGHGRDLRREVFTHVQQYSLEEFDSLGTASLITRSTNDITQIQQVMIMMLRMVVVAPIMFMGGLIMAISKDAKLSLIVVVIIPFLVFAVFIIMRKALPLFKAVQKRLDKLNLIMRENLTGIRVIRAFAKEDEERGRLKTANERLTSVAISVNKLMAFMMPGMMLVMNLSIVAIIWFGSIRIGHGGMQIGDLMAFIQYVMQMMFALVMASMLFVIVPRAAVSANRILEVLDEKSSIKDPVTVEKADQSDKLSFNQVTFHYKNSETPALENINFTSAKGQVTAIIGGTGSGKSTLLKLIPRFYDVSSGEILLNGFNIKAMTQADLRQNIGYVPQQAQLFSGTIAENIKYGNVEASMAEVIQAAKIAQAHEFIEAMPNGYAAKIEQGGSNLSGGQKQRVSIARALVRKPKLYLFDDSFSALDYKTDAALRKALQKKIDDAILLVVAQRVSTVIDADQIIVLEKGQIVGKGTHDELIQTNAVYQEIVSSQMGEGEIA